MAAATYPAELHLPAILDLQAAKPLANAIAGFRRRPLTLNASQVERLGGLCLQVLLAARTTWAADEIAFGVADSSAAFNAALILAGASLDPTPEARP